MKSIFIVNKEKKEFRKSVEISLEDDKHKSQLIYIKSVLNKYGDNALAILD